MSEEKPKYNVEKANTERAVLRKYAMLQKAFEDKIGCQKIYVDIAGGIHEAFILDELIYFTLPREDGKSGLRVRKEGFLWMAVSRSEWWERKRITPKEADGAIERLVSKQLVFKDYFLFNKQKTTHLRLNTGEFLRQYMDALSIQNPAEDEGDTTIRDIQDLYEMMGIPKEDTPEGIPNGEAGILKGDTVSPLGNSINSPHTSSTQPLGTDVPDLPLDWKIAGEQPIKETDLQRGTYDPAKARDVANRIGERMAGAEMLALAFQDARRINLSDDPQKIKGQRKAAKEMLAAHVNPEHVRQAVKSLVEKGMTVTDLFSVSKTAIALANPAEKPKETPSSTVVKKPPIDPRTGKVIR